MPLSLLDIKNTIKTERNSRMPEKQKKRWGDRRDGRLMRDIDPMHAIVPYVYPNRADNEAFIQESIEMDPIFKYVDKKNAELKAKVERGELPESALDDPYKPFYVMLMGLVKTMYLRPGLNRFVANMKLYQKDEVSVGFTVKKKFADNAAEGLAFKRFGPETTMDDLYAKIVKEINFVKDENQVDNSVDFMAKFMKLPPFILRPVFRVIRWLDRHGRVPYEFVKTDPNYASCFITNLGSIHLKSGYHHLSNWGTTSLFVIIGERKMKPFYDDEGNVTMKLMNDIGLTIDERIADGFYYAKSIRLFKKLMAEPELLDLRADEEVNY